ncbi:MAG: MFS transporter [Clostridia bacterium]|nr:MFS transporter [Clostridia bacterium]
MKLNVKRTVLVGFAFLAINSFWQMYDSLIPKILTGTFNISKTYSGIIMASDNILALFLLPLFGGLSDKCKSPLGRRRPFIIAGTLFAVVLMMGLPILDNSYYTAPSSTKTLLFIINLALLLIAMGTFRSPAVALMPDVTPKPLRSKGNAIINLMGAVGGVLYLLITSVLYSKGRTEGLEHISYVPIFAIVGGIMLVALAVIMLFVNEPKFCKEQAEYERQHPEDNLNVMLDDGDERMPDTVKKSLIFLLLSVAFWYIGYNGITTWFTVYAEEMWGMQVGEASMCLTVATVGAIASYIPVGVVASKVGRKRTIKFGAALLALCFFTAFLYTLAFHEFHFMLLVLFALVGVAWASINVNSLPMVVEMCSGSKVGKFTGFYYAFSMSAQIITPVIAGWLLEKISYKALFPYAAIAVAISFVTMCFVNHGDNKVESKIGLDAFDMGD